MGLLSLLFGFNGRINRAQYWLGNLGAGFAAILVVVLLVILGGPSPTGKPDPLHILGVVGLAIIPAALLLIWCGLALQVKRFHDRGRTGWLVVVPMGLSFFSAIGAVGAMMGGADPLTAASAGQPWGMLSWLVQIAYLIDLGFLPSKDGPNKYGNPPGGGASVAPAQPAAPMAKANVSATAASSLFGAQAAIDRAVAEKAQQRAAPRPQAPQAQPRPAMAGAPTAPASFGRRTTR